MKRFRKGIRLPEFKDRTLASIQIHLPSSPSVVTIPLNHKANGPLAPCVQEGDPVCVGTKLAEGSDQNSVPVYSSVSGCVSKVCQDLIQIESDYADRLDRSIKVREEIPSDASQLIEMIREAGMVDLGGSGIPIHTRLLDARSSGVEFVIVNGCESEPFLTADHVLVMNYPAEILKGAELIRIACGAKRAVIAVERNKREAAELLNSKNYNLKIKTIETMMLPVRYPQDSEGVLAETVTDKVMDPNSSIISQGVLVEHVATAFGAYEAIYLRKPLYERVVTVSGPCFAEPKNMWARTGVPAIELIRESKGFLRDPDRVIFGGPMTGQAISDLQTPVTMDVTGIVALPHELVPSEEEEACIRCGLCVDVCPEALVPETLVRAVRIHNDRLAQEYDIDACTECGCCAYVCPSKIPIIRVIQEGKRNVCEKTASTSVPTLHHRPLRAVGAMTAGASHSELP